MKDYIKISEEVNLQDKTRYQVAKEMNLPWSTVDKIAKVPYEDWKWAFGQFMKRLRKIVP
jgi:hypothetical protein